MLSQETLAEYRRMTPGQRLEFTFAMIRPQQRNDTGSR
jgi:hypothetical protein